MGETMMYNRFMVYGLRFIGLWVVMLMSMMGCAQVKLTQIEKDATKWKFPVAYRTISGQSGYHLKYISLPALMDSVGFSVTGTGTVISVATAYPVTGGTFTTAGTIGVDTTDATLTALATQYDLLAITNNLNLKTVNGDSVRGTGNISVGTVTSVSGTSPISVATGTTTPVISIATASTSTTGALTSTNWNTFNNKEPAIAAGTTSQYWRGDKTWQTLNTTNVAEGMYLYYTDARARAALTLTTTGSSGASTYNSGTGVLNIPTYTLAGLGGIGLTSLSATSPLSYNNTTGVFSMSQSGTGSNGWLSSTDWNTFNNKVSTRFQLNGAGSYYGGDLGLGTRNTGTYPAWAYSLGTIYYDMPAGSNGQVLKHNGTGWTAATDNNTNYDYWTVQANGGLAYAVTSLANINFANGTGINWSRSGGTMTATNVGVTSIAAGSGISVSGATGGVTITNNSPFSFLGVQANAGTISNTLTNGATLNLTGSGSTSVSRSGNTFTISSSGGTDSQNLSYDIKTGSDIPLLIQNGSSVTFREGTGISLGRTASNVMTVTNTSINTDNQTLSFSSPTLSISGGNNVTLPVLPTGTVNQTLRYDGSAWNPTSMLQTTTSRVDINSWPGTIILGSKLLVNGNIQYNSVGSAAATVAGRDADGGLTGVTVGSGLSLSAGTLSSTATGTVTSVGIINGGGITVSGSPVTTSGNITLTAADQSATNEIQVLSTSGAAGNVALSNGGGTININVNDADASITNEGYLGVVASGTYIKGYNSSGTATGNGVQMLAGDGLSVATGGNNTNGGQIQYSLNPSYGMLSNGVATLSSSAQLVNFIGTVASSNITASNSTDRITTTSSGAYEVKFTCMGQTTGEGLTVSLRNNGSNIVSYTFAAAPLAGTGGSSTGSISGQYIFNANSGDYYELWATGTASGSSSVQQCVLTAIKL